MSIFNNLVFLQDYPSDERRSDAPGHSSAQGYGNHVASAQAFAPLGHLRRPQGKATSAGNRGSRRVPAPCTAGACG